MPDPVEKKETTPAVEELQKSLQELKAQNDKYAKLVQDPNVQQLLGKMSRGEEVVFADKSAPSTPEAEVSSMKKSLGVKDKPEDVNLDELSNKQLVGIMAESVEEYVGGVREESSKQYEGLLAEMKGELTRTQEALLTLEARQQVKDVSSQHKDFESYRPAMQKLAEKYPQMEMEDLYNHVKGQHLMKSPRINEVESEKPESSSTFPDWQPSYLRTAKTQDGETEKSVGPSTTALRNRTGGRRDFSALVSKAAASLVSKSNIGGA